MFDDGADGRIAVAVKPIPLPEIVDVAGIFQYPGFVACVFAFSHARVAQRVCGELGITRRARGILKYATSFRRVPEHPYHWTRMSGADRDGQALFESLRHFSDAEFHGVEEKSRDAMIKWHERVRAEFHSRYTLTAFFSHSDWSPTLLMKSHFRDVLRDYIKTKRRRDHAIEVWLNPEIAAQAIRYHIGNIGFLLNAPALLREDGSFLQPGGWVASSRETVKRAIAYKQQCKRLSSVPYKFGVHLTFDEFDTMSPAGVPGAIGLRDWGEADPELFSKIPGLNFAINEDWVKNSILLPRHHLMSHDGNVGLDQLLDFGRFSCGFLHPFTQGHIFKLQPQESGYDDSTCSAWVTSGGFLVFAPAWLFAELIKCYYDGRFTRALALAKTQMSAVLTPELPNRARGRLYGSDLDAVREIEPQKPEAEMELRLRYHEIVCSEKKVADLRPYLAWNSACLALGAELSSQFLPGEFIALLKTLDASFLLNTVGADRVLSCGSANIDALRKILSQIIYEHIGFSIQEAGSEKMGVYFLRLIRFGISDIRKKFGDSCSLLVRGFAINIASLAFRQSLEGAGLLASMGNPPYPVAVWSKEWLISQWKRFAYSRGLKIGKSILSDLSKAKKVTRINKVERTLGGENNHGLTEATADILRMETIEKSEANEFFVSHRASERRRPNSIIIRAAASNVGVVSKAAYCWPICVSSRKTILRLPSR